MKQNEKWKMLIVDDWDDQLAILRYACERADFDVTTCKDADEAKAILDRHPSIEQGGFHVALVDLDLGDLKKSGLVLLDDIVQWRYKRGYNLSPEVICITGNERYKNPKTVLKVERIEGARYAIKALQAVVFTLPAQSAATWIDQQRATGPYLVIVHSDPTGLKEEVRREPVAAKSVAHLQPTAVSINGVPLYLSSAELAVLDCVAWYSGADRRKTKTYAEIAEIMSDENNPFHRWLAKGAISKDVVKVLFNKIKKKFEAKAVEARLDAQALFAVDVNDRVRINAWAHVEYDHSEISRPFPEAVKVLQTDKKAL